MARLPAILALAASMILTASPACAQQTEEEAMAEAAASATVTKVFQLPEGSRPHDAAPAPDGKVWYTAQRQGALGILDPDTGAVRQVPLGADSAPHGVIQGPDGAAWITDGGQDAIVRYDPQAAKIDVWKLPAGAGSTNLHSETGKAPGRGRRG